MEHNDAPCPRCGALDGIPVMYGYPGKLAMEAESQGFISLGGCILRETNPNWCCTGCGHQRRRLDPPDTDWPTTVRNANWLVAFWRRQVTKRRRQQWRAAAAAE